MTIRRLPPETVDRIAAGEVVERPASAVKELVENALDAGASQIEVQIEGGGLARILVADDGAGLAPDELRLAVERHATSKLTPDADGEYDLLRIATLGFRGEALPSIGSVSRLSLTSRARGASGAYALRVDGGVVGDVGPAAFSGAGGAPQGARVEVRDLFYATPARLKFMKTPRAEGLAIVDEIRRQSMAHPGVAFSLELEGKRALRFAAEAFGEGGRLARLAAVLGREFEPNALYVDEVREDVRLTGYIGAPTFHRGSSSHQFLFVNDRPVKDRLLAGALRAAYADVLARDRHPVAVLFVALDGALVDVNVHPAKAEVRFRDPALVRGLIVGGLRHTLAAGGRRTSTTLADEALSRLQSSAGWSATRPGVSRGPWPTIPAPDGLPGLDGVSARVDAGVAEDAAAYDVELRALEHHPLGAARAQLHETYVVAQTADGMVIVDQHAAHERLVYERLKTAAAAGGVARQALLLPEVVELDPGAAERVVARSDELAALGVTLEAFGPGAVLVRETPVLLGRIDAAALVRDIADDLAETGGASTLSERLAQVLATAACRGSVRAGRRLDAAEMNALLRQMEAEPMSGQCNHGRPTYVELKLVDIERLFGRR